MQCAADFVLFFPDNSSVERAFMTAKWSTFVLGQLTAPRIGIEPTGSSGRDPAVLAIVLHRLGYRALAEQRNHDSAGFPSAVAKFPAVEASRVRHDYWLSTTRSTAPNLGLDFMLFTWLSLATLMKSL